MPSTRHGKQRPLRLSSNPENWPLDLQETFAKRYHATQDAKQAFVDACRLHFEAWKKTVHGSHAKYHLPMGRFTVGGVIVVFPRASVTERTFVLGEIYD